MTAVAKLHTPDTDNELAKYRASIANMTGEQLLSEFAKELRLTADHFMRLAAIWAELKEKGIDLATRIEGRRFFLDHVIAGTVLAALVACFATRYPILRRLARMTIDDQRRVVDGESEMFVTSPGATKKFPIKVLEDWQVKQLVDENGNIRTEREQIVYIENKRAPKWVPGKPSKFGPCAADRKENLVYIGKAKGSALDMIKALRAQGMIPDA